MTIGVPKAVRTRALRVLPIVAITALAAILRLTSLGSEGSNAFYDAAVRSMSQSWHNFFFAAFEPAAGVSIDKPPIDLWLQVVTTKLFGFNSAALVLPQALAATLAVPLLYDTVRRIFGRAAGLAAALALAVLPVSVLVARSDTMDSLMMALDVLAAWLVVRAAETGRSRFLLLAAAVIGINFEVKLFEALIALPAIVLLYALAVRGRPRPSPRVFAFAAAICLVAALSWPAIVSLVPRGSRPYPIGSTNGSVWNAIFVFNGTQRVNPPTYNSPAPAAPPRPAAHRASLGGGSGATRVRHASSRHRHRAAGASAGRLSGTGDAPGPLRLFELGRRRYGQDFGIELAGALVFGGLALLGGLLAAWRRRRALGLRLFERPPPDGTAAEGSRGRTLEIAGAAAVALWVAIGYVLFSRMRGGLHDRYLESVTPAVAAAVGIGAVECAKLAGRSLAWLATLAVGLILMVLYAGDVAGSDTLLAAICAVAAAGAVAVGAAGLAAGRGRRTPWSTRAVVPLVAALTLICVLAPAAERSRKLVAQASGGSGGSVEISPSASRLSSFLRRNDGGAFYEAATYSFAPAAGLIIHDGRPVLVLTSYTSPVVSTSKLAAAVRAGKVRYAIIGGDCGAANPQALASCPDAIRWLRHRSVDVTRQAGLGGSGVLFRIDAAAARS